MFKIYEMEQGSTEWHSMRMGKPSASKFSAILAKGQGKTRRAYLIQKASEILTGEAYQSYVTPDMERGMEQEPAARALYEFQKDIEVAQIGLAILDDGSAIASPDGLVGEDGGIEIKSVLPHVHIETILSGKMPPGHMAQVQGCMYVLNRDYWDFISYSPTVTDQPQFVHRVMRDESYIDNLKAEIIKFNSDIQEVVTKIKG